LADACQDGVRKKAKYLHDAPPEALRPVLGPTFNPVRNGQSSGPLSNSTSASDTSPGTGGFFPQVNALPYSLQYQQMRQNQMPPPLQEPMTYSSQQSPISPNFATTNNHGLPNFVAPAVTTTNDIQAQAAFGGPLFDPSNPALFNFDLEGLNFGNQYGAMEFGMLGHMSSGAAETPPQDKPGSLSESTYSFNNSIGPYGQMYPQQDPLMTDYSGMENTTGNMFDMQRAHMHPRAYAIETGPTSLASPSTDTNASPQPSIGFDSSPTTNTFGIGSSATLQNQSAQHRHQKRQDGKSLPKLSHQTVRKGRDPSSIYTSVTEPYSYTTGFHSLTAFIQRRFSANATLKIAKSLASIRPSFISCTKTLNRQDLIFMEKCFQRTLFEYEEFMKDWGTPTLVCRRTGEVAAVNKEFTLMTGWTKSVLLGREPNLNINTGKSDSRTTSGAGSLNNTGRAGLTTPRMRPMVVEKGQENRPQPTFLAELLDDDSVVEFYEDFAKLAFGDSRGSVTKRCKLLKYLTKEGLELEIKNEEKTGESGPRKRKETGMGGRVDKIDAEHRITDLHRDGKMDCAYCWTVKRDVFDIPMLIVMNVSSSFHLLQSCPIVSYHTDTTKFLPCMN
jgi:hypothetical protein